MDYGRVRGIDKPVSRLVQGTASPVTMFVAPGPIELVQAKVWRRFFILA